MMDEMLEKQLDIIDKLDSVKLKEYKASIIKYSVDGELKTKILKACNDKLEKFDRSKVIVESSDIEDTEDYA